MLLVLRMVITPLPHLKKETLIPASFIVLSWFIVRAKVDAVDAEPILDRMSTVAAEEAERDKYGFNQ
ncbi:hypothetical protein LEN26_005331 [Aphanomyces euteiches]|nr:hypothetical protein AeMF1_005566 [Aphanomyces euteiches]KAH9138804.1 hypothetical protein LEN26_005331 [Aphanomyces euteiches]